MATRLRTFGAGAALAGCVVACALGLAAWAKFVWPRSPENAALVRAMADIRKPDWSCDPGPHARQNDDGVAGCSNVPPPGARVLLWGDSHAGQFRSGLARMASGHPGSIWLRYRPSCPPALGFQYLPADRLQGCEAFNAAVMRDLDAQPNVRTVVLGGRWLGYFGENADSRTQFESALDRTVTQIERGGRSVVILASGVDFPWPVPDCILRRGESACGRSREQAEARRAYSQEVLAAVVRAHPNIRVFDPMDTLCGRLQCPVSESGKVLYSDAHHLSRAGVDRLASALGQVL